MGQIACSWLSVMFIELTLARPSSGTGNSNCSGTWGTGRCLSVRVLTLANQLHLVLCLHPNSSLTAGFLAEASLPTSLRTYRSDWDSVVHTVCFFLCSEFWGMALKERVVLADLQGAVLGTGGDGKSRVEYVSMRLRSQDSFEKHDKGRNEEQHRVLDLWSVSIIEYRSHCIVFWQFLIIPTYISPCPVSKISREPIICNVNNGQQIQCEILLIDGSMTAPLCQR